MGSGRSSAEDWEVFAAASSYDTKSTAEIFVSRTIDPALDPRGVKVRESRDSPDNPESTAIIVALDVSGSMDMVSDVMARKGVPTLTTEIYNRKPVTDPHIMCMAIGDAEAKDRAPLQVTQFEADIRIAQQLEKFYLEGGGGGNSYESYALAWYFAANHTAIDCFEKRKKKGFLFTIGDELPTPYLRGEDIERVLGTKIQAKTLKLSDLLTAASRTYEIFHVVVEQGNYARPDPDRVVHAWQEVLGQRVLRLADHTKLSEVIVSAIQVTEGESHADVVKSWDGSTGLVVAKAIKGLSKSSVGKGVVTL